jgi:DNA protecting protein DprA
LALIAQLAGMDYRLALFLRTFHGLSLTEEDIQALLAAPDVSSPQLAELVVSATARTYIKEDADWAERSRVVVEFCAAKGIRWSYRGEPDYPEGWNHLSRQPLLFSYMGQPVWNQMPLISVVGSRTPLTDTLVWMQRELSRFLQLTEAGVVSGGARGVDQWAHRLALAGRRPTIAVFPSGLCAPYPFGREDLWEAILLQDGCLLSTYSLHEPMRKQHFIERNRWIAALSDITFVAEANRRSGSLITATKAIEVEHEVGTLPVSANCTQGLGSLDLMLQGAHLIRDAGDLLTLFNRNRGRYSGPRPAQGVHCEKKEDQIDQPERDSGGDPSAAGGAHGGHIENPVGDEDDEAHDEAAAARGPSVGDGAQAHAQQRENQAGAR